MTDGPNKVASRLLISIWLVAIVGGLFVSLVMSYLAFRDGNDTNGVVLGAIAVGKAQHHYGVACLGQKVVAFLYDLERPSISNQRRMRADNLAAAILQAVVRDDLFAAVNR